MQCSFRPVALRLPLSAVAALADVTALLFLRPQLLPRIAYAFRLQAWRATAISQMPAPERI